MWPPNTTSKGARCCRRAQSARRALSAARQVTPSAASAGGVRSAATTSMLPSLLSAAWTRLLQAAVDPAESSSTRLGGGSSSGECATDRPNSPRDASGATYSTPRRASGTERRIDCSEESWGRLNRSSSSDCPPLSMLLLLHSGLQRRGGRILVAPCSGAPTSMWLWPGDREGAGSRRSQCRGDASGCLRRPACSSRRWRKTRLAAHQGLMLWRDVRRMRPGGEGACVTTLLEMPIGAQR
mmetsp:Transcript_24662/g.81282  ORF Transcript_24662/g.81282 Transcript_24662/m.81282 type:complete len:240 (+) Transcript_24662:698-1417(+)